MANANHIAQCVFDKFACLPTKRKPQIRDNGLHEWVPLSGVVMERENEMMCLSLATGMQCLPVSKLPASKGVRLHDWHAEVLAIRAFNRYLLDECHEVLAGNTSLLVERTSSSRSTKDGEEVAPFRIMDTVKLHMYCSEAPCGDASMELIMAAQDDPTSWEVPSLTKDEIRLPGRAFFSQLGIVRRKPARGDAPPTMSKSCSDKIALKQCISLLSSISALFLNPENVYIHTLVLPASQYSQEGCQRAFSATGRMAALRDQVWGNALRFRPFAIEPSQLEFEYSRRAIMQQAHKICASNLATVWTASGVEETILGGVLQGRKAFDPRGASRTSRLQMLSSAISLGERLSPDYDTLYNLSHRTYREVKESALLHYRKQAKDEVQASVLLGWVKNEGDSGFSIPAREST